MMGSGQSGHVIPIKKSDRLLIGNSSEKTLPYILSNDFIFKAKQDGYVESIDTETNIMIVTYKDGSHDAINLAPAISKNGGGGFWISNTLVTDFKEKDKFKKDDILAKNNQYFSGEKGSAEYVTGCLTKVAIHGGLNIVHVKIL